MAVTPENDVCTCDRLYGNEWDVVGELGRGCFGVVYHMREKKTTREFAMKMIDSDKTNAANQFIEAWNSKRKHDNVVWLTSCNYSQHGLTDKGHILLCMELCSKKTLQTWLEENPTQRSLDYVKPYMWQILSALCCLHGQGVIHRDLKPNNIMFANDYEYSKKGGMLKVGDFGMITRCIDEAEGQQNKKYVERGSFVTRVHKHTYGAPLYEAPEKSGLIYNNKIDVVSYGLICAEMLCEFKNPRVKKTVFDILRKGQGSPKLLTKQPEVVKDFIKSATKPKPSERMFATDLRKHAFFEDIRELPEIRRPKLQLFAQTIYLKDHNAFLVVKINVQVGFEKNKDKLSFARCKEVQDIINVQTKLFDYVIPESSEQEHKLRVEKTNEEKLYPIHTMSLIPPFKYSEERYCRLGLTIPFAIQYLPRETVPREDKSAMIQRIKNLQLGMTGTLDDDANYDKYNLNQMAEYVNYLYAFAERMEGHELTFFALEVEREDQLDDGSLVKLIPGIDLWHKHPRPDYVEDVFDSIENQSCQQYINEIFREIHSKGNDKPAEQEELYIRKQLIPISSANFLSQKRMKETLSEILELPIPSNPKMILMRIKTLARVLNSRDVKIRHRSGNDDLLKFYLFFLIDACGFILEMSEEGVYFNVCFSNSLVHVALSPVIDTSLVLPTFEVFIRRYWTDWSNIGWKVFAHIARESEAANEIEKEMLKNGKEIVTLKPNYYYHA